MKKQSHTDALNEKIRLLQNKQERELIMLKARAHIAYESLKPINLIKSTFHEVASSPDLKNNIVSNVIGIATGFLSRKVLIGASRNPVKMILGTLLQFGIANLVSNHSDTIKLTGEKLLHRILNYKKRHGREFSGSVNGHYDERDYYS